MKKLILLLVLISCSPKLVTKTEYKEIYKTDTVTITLPKEIIYQDIDIKDTLVLETSISKSKSWVDNNKLKGTISNKPIKLDTVILTKEVYKTDSVIIEKPVKEVVYKTKKPSSYSFLLGWFIATLGFISSWIIYKIWKPF